MVGDEPYVVPLVEAYLREQGYLVILADTHRRSFVRGGPWRITTPGRDR